MEEMCNLMRGKRQWHERPHYWRHADILSVWISGARRGYTAAELLTFRVT